MSNLISPMLLKIADILLIICALLLCVYVACSLLIIITYYSLLLLINFIRCNFVLFFGCLFNMWPEGINGNLPFMPTLTHLVLFPFSVDQCPCQIN